ncbi:MAG: AAA family ATPase, partial [Chloroflexota bacterium]|nr:AAA family ATPase [Chloroflexota bacterium]
MRTLRIGLLGDFQLIYGADPVTSVNTPRLQSLLTYLLLHRQAPQARQHIAFQFWPDSSEKQAHTNLRKLLFQLRAALPDADCFLTQDHLSVQWQPDAPYVLDVAELQAALARCQNADGKPTPNAPQADLTRVANLYQGELLPSCQDEWLLPLRQQLQRQVMQSIEQLISRSEHGREYRAGIRYAQRLLGLDPFDEATYRRLMQLHALNGDRAAALHDYHTCATLLQRELGVEPDEETHALYERILNSDHRPLQLPRLVEAPMVGRATEWRTLLAAWRRADRSGAQFVSLAGEAGIGKTRLAEELLAWASAQGIRAARTRSYEAEGGLAYAPLIEWLRARPLKTAFKHLDTLWLSEVARLLPELLTDYPKLTPPAPLSELWQRHRFFEGLARALLADKEPLLLLIDDLQWCDPETLAWLRFLLRYAPAARLLVVGAWRSEAVDEAHPLQVLLRDLQGANQLVTIELASLTAAETAELAQRMTEQPLDPTALAALHANTEGHPLFIVETVRASERNQELEPGFETAEDAAATPTVLVPISPRHALPPKVNAVLQARLAQLSAPARELAGLAATIGRRFTFGVLLRAGQFDEDTLVRTLDELWQRRIVREQGADAYDFSHDKLRAVAYAALSHGRRRLLHRQVAAALETVYGAHLDEVSGQLAAHYEQASVPAQARVYWQRAGVWAATQFANDEAVRYLSQALALTPPEERTIRFELLCQREAVFALQGQSEARLADLTAMQESGQAILAHDATQASLPIQANMRLGEYYQGAGQPEAAVSTLRQAITLAQQHGEPGLEAGAWARLGDTLFHQAKLAQARAALVQAIDVVAGQSLPDVEARAY